MRYVVGLRLNHQEIDFLDVARSRQSLKSRKIQWSAAQCLGNSIARSAIRGPEERLYRKPSAEDPGQRKDSKSNAADVVPAHPSGIWRGILSKRQRHSETCK